MLIHAALLLLSNCDIRGRSYNYSMHGSRDNPQDVIKAIIKGNQQHGYMYMGCLLKKRWKYIPR